MNSSAGISDPEPKESLVDRFFMWFFFSLGKSVQQLPPPPPPVAVPPDYQPDWEAYGKAVEEKVFAEAMEDGLTKAKYQWVHNEARLLGFGARSTQQQIERRAYQRASQRLAEILRAQNQRIIAKQYALRHHEPVDFDGPEESLDADLRPRHE